MDSNKSEACGRCAMTAVVDVATEGKDDDERAARDPFGEARIEVPESEMRAVSPSAWLGGVKRRMDELATKLTYRR